MAPTKCTWCDRSPQPNEPEFKPCSSCKSAHYCSERCRSRDEKYHKLLCDQYLNFMETRPHYNHKLAILLPEHQEQPRLIWVHCQQGYGSRGWRDRPTFEPHLGSDVRGIFASRARRVRNLYELDHTVQILYKDDMRGRIMNTCVEKAMHGKEHNKFWKGDMMALSLQGTDSDPQYYQDFPLSDLPVVFEFFRGCY
jgi:hypothetical protein